MFWGAVKYHNLCISEDTCNALSQYDAKDLPYQVER